MYYAGQGVSQDYVKAAHYYSLAADPSRAASLNRRWGYVMKAGDDRAQTQLGFMYAHGLGVQKYYAQALYWYNKASDQGNIQATTNLGWLYENGYGVTQDYAEAAALYLKAASGGNARAAANIGNFYSTGQGVQRDDEQAFFWMAVAAERMSGPSRKEVRGFRDTLAEKLTATQLSLQRQRVANWLASHP